MNIYPLTNEEHKKEEFFAKLQYSTLGHFCIKSELYYDPNPKLSIIEED